MTARPARGAGKSLLPWRAARTAGELRKGLSTGEGRGEGDRHEYPNLPYAEYLGVRTLAGGAA